MNISVPDSWLREYLETEATPKQIKDCLSLCGPSVEKIDEVDGDFVYEIEITSNRVDTACVCGIAQEAAAILPRFGIKASLKQLVVETPGRWPKDSFQVEGSRLPMEVADPQKLCQRIMGIVMEVGPMKQSADFVRKRIEESGVRSLNNLVDVTNYVMLELGRPTHVFDYDRIKTHKFLFRFAKKDEPIVTLDKKKYLLNKEDVIIDDGTGRVIDLPGIMGTENSVVTKDTRRIFFFIEANNPVLTRRTSMRYGIRTMAATINEKHPDPESVKTALLRGIELYQELAQAKVAGEIIDIYPEPPKPQQIKVTTDFINERLGVELKTQEIAEILKSLQFKIQSTNNNLPDGLPGGKTGKAGQQLTITPPSYRQFDVTIPEDVVEEVARIYGYHNLPGKLMTGEIPANDKPKILFIEEKIKTVLKYWGHTEIYTYSFVSKALIEKAQLEVSEHLKVANPLTEDIEYMRISLIPSMLETIARNQFYSDNLKLFEMANIYVPQKDALPDEIPALVLSDQSNFFKLKGIVIALLKELGISGFSEVIPQTEADFAATWKHFWHPQQLLSLNAHGKILGYIGKIHPKLSENFQIKNDTYLSILNVNMLSQFSNPIKVYKPIPTYPPVIEDITISYPPKTYIGPIISEIYQASKLVKKVEMIDQYKNSTTLRITYQDESKNLESEDVKKIREQITSTLKETTMK